MAGDWIKIHRRIENHKIWKDDQFSRGQAWIDLIILANWNEGYVRIRGKRVPLKRGQLAGSSRFLADRWKWSRGKVNRFLDELETDHQIDQQKNNVITLITITNYDEYQDDRTTDATTDRTTNRTTDATTDRTNNKKKQRRNKEETKNNPVPSELDTVEFGNAWSEWEQHRREIKKKLTPLAVKKLMNSLVKMGHDRAISAIHNSIAQGYTGIYEGNQRGNGNAKPEMFSGIKDFLEEDENDQK
jgi:hypothetical protein